MEAIKEIRFKRDTSFRKQVFVADSFAHPAKMDSQLLIWIVEKYTQGGDTILDPMAGSGTTMLACTIGRHVILVELEDKFCKMMAGNWQEISMRPQLGHTLGGCQIIQGDARQLDGLLVDKCIFSPPYAEAQEGSGIAKHGYQGPKHGPTDLVGKRSYMPDVHGKADGQIGNLPYGQIDKIVTSPPHGASLNSARSGIDWSKGKCYGKPRDRSQEIAFKNESNFPTNLLNYGDNPDNLGNLHYGNIDSIITSPPYEEGGGHGRGQRTDIVQEKRIYTKGAGMYSEDKENIGEMRGGSYLEAMLQVYQQCNKALKPDGLMILVTKNFIRNKQVVRLDSDTIKICEQAGFIYLERYYRKLPAQSFWRTIYHQKHPEVEKINHEDVLVFEKNLASTGAL